jgi:Uncharacterized protein conserved in bacteria (DUF2062)
VRADVGNVFVRWDSLSDDIAITLAIGLVLGTFPVYGVPTLLCVTAARALRLNPVALLAVNQFVTPVQLALLVPYARVGWHISVSPAAPVLYKLAATGLQAITGWCLVGVPAGILIHFALLYVVRRARRAQLLATVSCA